MPVSIVCVFNDEQVRRRCLDRSIEDGRASAPDTEYIPMDNTTHKYATAGAALNAGAAVARHDVVAFAHQDVALHSLPALEEAAAHLLDEKLGLLGAVGIASDGRIIGRMRDRVILIGESTDTPIDVDSLDEVLFLIRRDQVLEHPLSTSADLAWHAYAVEYGMRVRRLGLRVAAVDIPHTHNSMTTNLARLREAHEKVAALYPEQTPLRTTCGVVGAHRRTLSGEKLLEPQRWRYRWAKESVKVHRLRRRTGFDRWVLGDIRIDVDGLLAVLPDPPLRIVSWTDGSRFADAGEKPLDLLRGDVAVELSSGDVPRLLEAVQEAARGASVLLTDLNAGALTTLRREVGDRPAIAGWDSSIGAWLVLGPAAALAPPVWTTNRARPLGLPALA